MPHSKRQAAPASGHGQFAWWRRNYVPEKNGGCGATNLDQDRHSRSGRIPYSWLSTPAPNWVLSRFGLAKPANILDLFTEFRDRTNGLATLAGSGLVGALTHFGFDAIAVQEKDRLRLLILRGGPWSDSERKEIIEYCATDIGALERLLLAMLPKIDLPRSCFAVATWRLPQSWNGRASRSTCRR